MLTDFFLQIKKEEKANMMEIPQEALLAGEKHIARYNGRFYEHYPFSGENLGTGNRCGHVPESPAWHLYNPLKTKVKLPALISDFVEKAKAYYDSPKILPTLANLNGKTNQDGQPRLNRSEIREAESLIMMAVFSMTEYSTLRVGTPLPNGDFVPRSCVDIATAAGLVKEDGKPKQRFWRAFRNLKNAGAWQVHRQYQEMPDGSKRARPAIKNLNMHFLVAMGCCGYEKLKKFRTWCSNKLKKLRGKYRQDNPAASDAKYARNRVRMGQLMDGVNTHKFINKRTKSMFDADTTKELRRQYNLEQVELIAKMAEQGKAPTAAAIMKELGSFEQWIKLKQPQH